MVHVKVRIEHAKFLLGFLHLNLILEPAPVAHVIENRLLHGETILARVGAHVLQDPAVELANCELLYVLDGHYNLLLMVHNISNSVVVRPLLLLAVDH